ncbi:MAG TPA: alpha/beta hydrolase-fold protein [Thermoanaerobaculia bacterium]|nr:alpha/beta hydrolase-fold protein [Thermoanaerobaculia bacterium]
MRRRHELIPSRAMGRRINVWCYGHWGTPLMVFPTAAGFAHEWDAQGMLEDLAPLIYGGKIKLYCPESNVSEALTAKEGDPAHRIHRYRVYEDFVLSELVPWIRQDCGDPAARIAATGASLGGLYAANFALKFPETFFWALCMSGRYEVSQFLGGFANADVYFNSPLAFVPNLQGEHLERVRRNTHIVLVCGQGPWEEGCIEETIALGQIFAAKGISHERDIWGHDVSHNWAWWKRQAVYHLGKAFGG